MQGYQVYSEITPKYTLRRADVVGLTPTLTTVVEMKTSLSFDLLEQAIEWIPNAHYIYVCVPKTKKRNTLAIKVMKQYGIGLLEVDTKQLKKKVLDIKCVLSPRINKRVNPAIRESITVYHKKYSPEGGSSKGGHVTEYKITMIKVKELLTKAQKGLPVRRIGKRASEKPYNIDGWMSISDILDYCETHYAAPKQSLGKALMSFEEEWCESKKMNGKWYFRIKGE